MFYIKLNQSDSAAVNLTHFYAGFLNIQFISCSFQGSPSEDRNFRSDADDTETEEASFSGQDDSTDLLDILEWAKVL